jgi:hypothetical protein
LERNVTKPKDGFKHDLHFAGLMAAARPHAYFLERTAAHFYVRHD